ncbi:MAG: DNA polymerase II large subunit [Candidatus Diapherotrites archaeon]
MNFKVNVKAEDSVKKYYEHLAEKMSDNYNIAKEAKEKGLDISTDIETTPALDLADRTETIIGPPGIGARYRTVMKEMKNNRELTIFKIFKELIEQEWYKIPDDAERITQAIKTALVLNTEGVVVAPLDGVPRVEINSNPDGSKYIDIYYAGPIRAAGGTSAVLPLILGDYARVLMGLDRYKPTEDEVKRYAEEVLIYEEIYSRQYKISEDEIKKIVRGCPVCINGEPTEDREVSLNRDLKRIPTNKVRGGMCLVVSDGIALKAKKILKFSRMLKLDWDWLEDIIKVGKSDSQEKGIKPNEKYLIGTAAGRPIFAYPSRIGGFRLRYGRGRNMGIMGKGCSPATMYALDEFIAVGTQIKVERPGKAAGMAAVDSIEGPIVKLKNGNVVKIKTAEEAIGMRNDFEKILFIGDLLVAVGDFNYSAHSLVPAGYCEEWWAKEIEKKIEHKTERIKELIKNPEKTEPYEAVELSEKYSVPLNPKFLHYYSAIKLEDLKEIISALNEGRKIEEHSKIVGIEIDTNEEIKEIFENIGLPHSVENEKIVIDEEYAYPLLKTFGVLKGKGKLSAEDLESKNIHQVLSKISGLEIRDKAGTWIGARMGRPEASRPRKMIGNPNVLFPIGLWGTNTRSINKAMSKIDEKNTKLDIEIAEFKCPKCGKINYGSWCLECGERTVLVGSCPKCKIKSNEKKCPKCGTDISHFSKRQIDLSEIISHAEENLGVRMPELVKGVKGIINADKICEPLEKGIIRARHNVHIFRDGTIRYELINAPLTHFKPKEIKLSVEAVKKLGYVKDIHGNPIESDEQMLEIFPQDMIIHDKAGDFFVSVTQFMDELMERFYKLPPVFNMSSREELIDELFLGLAPHTSAGIIGRVIGFTKSRVCFAHPYFHQTKRRNIDGDQDSIMLLMDGLVNFSQSYLPSSRGGRMDAPLVFTVALNPTEIDEEVHLMETCFDYPLEFYEKAEKFYKADDSGLEFVKNRLDDKKQYSGLGYTHETNAFDDGPSISRYVQLTTMEGKMKAQAELQNSISAVDSKDALERVLATHFFPDIIGNARAFSRQTFRCTNCNTKYRRIPLNGKCTKCGKDKIILTIAQGSVRKYLEIARKMIYDYELGDYLKQRIDLISDEIDSIFAGYVDETNITKDDKQKSLLEFV